MNSERIKEIQQGTAYPNSLSVKQALLQVWNECEQNKNKYSEEEVLEFIKYLLSKKVTKARNVSDLEEYLPKEFQLLSGELTKNGKDLLLEWSKQFKKK